MAARPLIGLDFLVHMSQMMYYYDHALSIVRPSSLATEQHSRKLNRNQDLNIFFQVGVFRSEN